MPVEIQGIDKYLNVFVKLYPRSNLSVLLKIHITAPSIDYKIKISAYLKSVPYESRSLKFDLTYKGKTENYQ